MTSASELISIVSTDLIHQVLDSGARIEARVESGSMAPLIRIGDVIKVARILPEALAKGDIVVYKAGSSLAVHRLVARLRLADGTKAFLTKGDANGIADPPAVAEEIVGRIEQIVTQSGRTVSLTGCVARIISRAIAELSYWSGKIWGYRDRSGHGIMDRAGKSLVKPVGAVIRRVYVLLNRLVTRLC